MPNCLLAPEVSALLHYLPDLHSRMPLSTLWNSGFRINEALALTRADFNLSSRLVCSAGHSARKKPPGRQAVRVTGLPSYAYTLFSCGCQDQSTADLSALPSKAWLELRAGLKKMDAPTLSLEKPLFDLQATLNGEIGFVMPDFIVTASKPGGKHHTVEIETIGYTDDDDCERKAEQHKGMRELGLLQTDPPRWTQELDKTFSRHVFGIFMNLID